MDSGRVGIRAPEDVRVAERVRAALRAVLVGSWTQRRRVSGGHLVRGRAIARPVGDDGLGLSGEHVVHEGLAIRVDVLAYRSVADVVPHRRAHITGSDGVVVVAYEL